MSSDRLFEATHLPVYTDENLLVVDKPPGLPSTGKSLADPYCLQAILMTQEQQKLWAVHQLDADTSGVIVFTRNKKSVSRLQTRMRFPKGRKTYLALCHGNPDFTTRRIEAPIGPTQDAFGWGVTPTGKHAATHVVVLTRSTDFALLAVVLETGRTHQIRVHLASLGHPLVGEYWYRKPSCERHPRQALHAARIDFFDGLEPSSFVAPLRPDLQRLATALKLQPDNTLPQGILPPALLDCISPHSNV